jgi:type I restriction enzyme S subunit
MKKQIVTLGSIAIPNGIQTGPFGSQLKAEEYTIKGVPVVMPKDISAGSLKSDSIACVPETKAKKLTKHRLAIGDILFPRRGDLGRIGVAKPENVGWLCGTGCLRARLKNEVNSNYIHQYVQLEFVKKWLERNALGQTMLNLNSEIISNLPVYIVSIKQQTAIADLLSTWDTAIEKIERLIAAKEKRFKYFSSNYLFGANSGEKPSTKKTRWFTVPEHWQITRIGKIAKEVSITNGPNSNVPVLSCTKYDGLVDSLSYFDKQIFSADTSKYKVVRKGQFAYATNHIEEGSIGYQDLYPAGLVSPMYTVFETNDLVDDSYLYKVLKTEVFRHIFQVNTSASVDRRGGLRWKEFAKLPVPLPPMEEQKQIATTLNTAQREIDLLKKQLDAYRKQKRGLMQKLLTGKWRVKMVEKEILPVP